jgi:hypothetical protein
VIRLSRRALLLGVAILAAAPCCSSSKYPARASASVGEEAARLLDCGPSSVHVTQSPGERYYVAEGCGRSLMLECSEFGDGVTCREPPAKSGGGVASAERGDGDGNGNGNGDTSFDDSGGCGCGHLFHGKHSTNDPSTPNNPSSTTPQRTKR